MMMSMCETADIARSMLSVTIGVLVAGVSASAEPRDIDFNRDVRPILSDRCYACHGPDEHSREADLRLDQRESALRTNEGRAAIVPEKP